MVGIWEDGKMGKEKGRTLIFMTSAMSSSLERLASLAFSTSSLSGIVVLSIFSRIAAIKV